MQTEYFRFVLPVLPTSCAYFLSRQYQLFVQSPRLPILKGVLWSCWIMYDLLLVMYHLCIDPHRMSEQQDLKGSRTNSEAALQPSTSTRIKESRSATKQPVPVC
jgi:hypothetical protein